METETNLVHRVVVIEVVVVGVTRILKGYGRGRGRFLLEKGLEDPYGGRLVEVDGRGSSCRSGRLATERIPVQGEPIGCRLLTNSVHEFTYR